MRYILHPRHVRSYDGDHHFIEGPRLASLYGVDILLCVFGDRNDYIKQPRDARLSPRYDGDYTLPAEVKNERR